MPKYLKIILSVLAGLLILVAAALLYLNNSSLPDYQAEVAVPAYEVATDSATIARGRSLALHNCAGCHRYHQPTFAGHEFADLNAQAAFGNIYVPNLTRHPEHGIEKYTPGELYRLLRTGVKQNGTLLLPIMPRYPLMAEADIAAIIAFLKSDDPLVAATDKPNATYEPTLLANLLRKVVLGPIPYQEAAPSERPALTDQLAYGAYLVEDGLGCYLCHSASLEEWNLLEPTNTPGYLEGGTVFRFDDYEVTSPGILIREGNEVHNWTQAQFVAALLANERPGKPEFREPMHPYPHLDTAEVVAIYNYLKVYEPDEDQSR